MTIRRVASEILKILLANVIKRKKGERNGENGNSECGEKPDGTET
jgi:hypothetical protein